MRISVLTVAVVVLLIAAAYVAFAADPLPPAVTDMQHRLETVGCNAEAQAAAQEIVRQQGVIDALQKQLEAKAKAADPPGDPLPTPSPMDSPKWTPRPPVSTPTPPRP